MLPKSRIVTLLVVTIAVAVLLMPYVVHAQEYTYSFRYSPIVKTELKTFSATGSLVIYIPPGAYGKINVTVQATNPGSSAASITVSAGCANTPSVTFTVPAGGSATGTLTIVIPTPPTSYVACPITASVPNVTGVSLQFMYSTDIEMVYNTTTVEYTFKLFTEPYFVIGSNYYYFNRYNITLARHGTTLVNATFTAKFTDSYVSLVGVYKGSDLIVEIGNTYHYTGRYLGEVTLVAKINEKTANLLFLPSAISPSSTEVPNLIATPDIAKAVLASGESVKIGIPLTLTVIDSSGSTRTVTVSRIVRFDTLKLPEGVSKISEEATVGTYKVLFIGQGVPKNGTEVTVLALANLSNWFEPIYTALPIVEKYLNVTVLWSQGADVVKYVKVMFEPLGVSKTLAKYGTNMTVYLSLVKPPTNLAARYVTVKLPDTSNYMIIRAVCEGSPLYDYVYYVGYVAMLDKAGTVVKHYLNVTDAAVVPDSSVSASLVGTVPKITITLSDYYDVVNGAHAALFVPAYGSTVLMQTVTVVAPIRFVYTPIVKTSKVSTVYMFIITDNKEYSKEPRRVYAPPGITLVRLSRHCYMSAIPVTYNDTPLTFDLSADLVIHVTWNNGKPASGVIVEVWKNDQLIYRGATDKDGNVLLDPTYGTYTVKAIYGNVVVSKQISTLTNDVELSLSLPVPPPKVEVTQVLITAPSKVYVGDKFTIVVTVYTNKAPSTTFTVGGEVVCTGPVTKTFTVLVTVPKGSTMGRGVVTAVLDKAGTYTCWAQVGGVKSVNVVQIQAETKPVALIPGLSPEVSILVIIAVLFLIVLIAIFVYIAKASRRVRTIPETVRRLG